MPFGEVMYRCNAHYCFSSVFRNRVAGLVITLALMQLFLFSFYLNGLHSQVVVTTSSNSNGNTGGGSNSPVSSLEQHEYERAVLQLPAVAVAAAIERLPSKENPKPKDSIQDVGVAAAAAVVRDIDLDRRSGRVGQERPADDPFLNQSISKARAAVGDAAKKALDHLMTNKKPAIDLMALAAKKLSSDPSDPVAKIGLNLLANAMNNVKNQQAFQPPKREPSADLTTNHQQVDQNASINGSSSAVNNDVEDQTKSQYANLAQMGLQMLANGLVADSSSSSNKGSSPDNRVMEMASQLMWQSAKLSSKAGFDPQMAKSALGLLRGAVANQKLDPRIMFGLATKMMQLQSAAGDTNANVPGLNLLSQLLSNSQLTTALLSAGAAAASATKPVTAAQSKIIYHNYVKMTNQKMPKLKSKMPSPYSSPSNKVVVDIGFHYTLDKVKACRANATFLILSVSSATNTEERQAARETWIKDLRQLIGDQFDVVFIIGQTANVTVQRSVVEESNVYQDLIQTNVQEPVENAVFKTLAGLVWIERNCPEIEQILKMDDDVYVSAPRMLRAFKDGKASPSITGSMIDNMNPHTTSGKYQKDDLSFHSSSYTKISTTTFGFKEK